MAIFGILRGFLSNFVGLEILANRGVNPENRLVFDIDFEIFRKVSKFDGNLRNFRI